MINESLSLQKLLCKILNKSIVDKFHNELQRNNINHNKLSIDAGKHSSAFNKTFNNMEQLSLSSFLRYWYAASNLTSSSLNSGPFSLNNFIQDEELQILRLICSIKDSSIDSLENSDIQLLKHLKCHFDFLEKNNKLAKEEIEIYNKIFYKDVIL